MATRSAQFPVNKQAGHDFPTFLPNGHFYVAFTCTPNVPDTVKYADEVNGSWLPLTNLIAEPSGYIGVEDFTAPAPPKRYYRAVYP